MRAVDDPFMQADGVRYVVSQAEVSPGASGLRIVDSTTREVRTFAYRELEEVAEPNRCGLFDAHKGFALVGCEHPRAITGSLPWIVDLSTLDAVTPPGETPRGRGGEALHFPWLGTHWLAASCGLADEWCFWNWRTGERRQHPSDSGDYPPRWDLDTSDLVKFPTALVARDGRAAVYSRRQADGTYRLVLHRGSQRVRLTRCPCGRDVVISRGRVAWTRGRFLYSYRIRDGRRIRWRVPGRPPGAYGYRELLHTRNRLFVRDWDGGDRRVSAATWPEA